MKRIDLKEDAFYVKKVDNSTSIKLKIRISKKVRQSKLVNLIVFVVLCP